MIKSGAHSNIITNAYAKEEADTLFKYKNI